MPEPPFQPVHLPRGESVPDAPKGHTPGPKMQRGTLSIVLAIVGPLLFGGILAEIFHTGRVFSSAVSSYSAALDKGTREGLDLLVKEMIAGFKEAKIAEGEANAQADQKLQSAKIEAERIRTEKEISTKITLNQQIDGDLSTSRNRYLLNLFKNLRPFSKFKSGRTLRIGMRYADEERGFNGLRVFPVDHELQPMEMARMCGGFQCFQMEGAPPCEDEWGKSEEEPAKEIEPPGAIANDWPLTLTEHQRMQLGYYRQTLRDLESAILHNAIDLERFKRSNPNAPEAEWVNRELSRLTRGLQNTRDQINATFEIEYLASNGQRNGLASALHGRDFLRSSRLKGIKKDGSAQNITEWIDGALPASLQAVRHDIDQEHAAGSSFGYWSVRPFLANIWFMTHWGDVYPLRLFRSIPMSVPAASFLDSARPTNGWGIPSWMILAPTIALVALSGRWIFHRSKKASICIGAVLGVCTVLGVQTALQYNSATEEATDAITRSILASIEAYPYSQRGPELGAEIATAARNGGSALLSRAQVASDAMTAKTTRITAVYANAGICMGMTRSAVNNDVVIMARWVLTELKRVGPDDPFQEELYKLLDAIKLSSVGGFMGPAVYDPNPLK